MDEMTLIVTRSHRLEWLLKEHYHAKGKGLPQLIASCEERLPADVVEKLRLISTIRHKIRCEENFHLDDFQMFLAVCNECEKGLQPRSNRMIWRFAIFLIFAVTLGAMWFYFSHWFYLLE